MKQIFIALSLAAFVFGCAREHAEMGAPDSASQSTASSTTAVVAEDSNFAREALATGMAEVEMGQLTARNTKNEAVVNFGKKIVEDHTAANKELEEIATRKGFQTEKQPPALLKSSLEKLAGLKDREFDQAFKQQAIQDHEKAIQLFEKQSKQGADVELKAFAQKHLPHLREHLTMLQKLEVSSDTPTQVDDTTEQIKPTTPPDSTTAPK